MNFVPWTWDQVKVIPWDQVKAEADLLADPPGLFG